MTNKTLNRYIWLLNTLLQNKGQSLEEINRRWQQSPLSDGKPLNRRTFIMHCDALEELFGIHIKCDLHNGYKYSISSRAQLYNNRMHQWLINSFSLSNMIETGHNMQRRILLEDIPHGSEYLQIVIEAMHQGRELYVEHQKFGGDKTIQHLQPYALKACRQRWYVLGYIHEHGALRNIALDRVLSMELTDQPFTIPEDFNAEQYYAHSIGIYVNDQLQPEHIVLRAYGITVNYLRSLPLHPSQVEINTQPGEYSDFTYNLCLTPDLTNEILGMGENVQVLEPESLRQAVRERVQAILKHYQQES